MVSREVRSFRCRRVLLECYEEVLPNGINILVDRVVFPKSVAILPLWRREKRVALVKQYRPAVREWLLEAPAGTLKEGESPLVTATRELREEAGLKASSFELVGEGFVSPGYSTEYMFLFIAWDPEPVARELEPHEVIEVVYMSLDEALAIARDGGIRDLKTLFLLAIAKNKIG
ncbi:MAG: NUDIX hydrolase [Acidilobaceae archaeon]